jgi:hypothetical protein
MVTTFLIPADAFQPGGKANGRALAYLAHAQLGEWFGALYDLSTILILWFAGASAMAGLINIVPRYLPRYGMAPEWARASRPLVLLYTAIAFFITWLFDASVDAQGGAYATGVLVLMTSGAVAVTLSCWRRGAGWITFGFAGIALVFGYTTIVNVIERPDGVKIAAWFIAAIVLVSLLSRVWRSFELRVERVELDETARWFIEALGDQPIHIIAHRPRRRRREDEYAADEQHQREDFLLRPDEPVMFLEVFVADASEFSNVLKVQGQQVGTHQVLRAEATAVPNAIAALLLYLRDTTGKRPAVYFNWGEGNPFLHLVDYVLSGHGDVPEVTREVIRQAEPNHERRPAIYAGV